MVWFTAMRGLVLPQFRWDWFDCLSELLVMPRIYGAMPYRCARRICVEMVATFPVVGRPDWPGTKTSATVRTDIVQDAFNAVTAESAFKRANHRVSRIGRKRRIAILASRSQFEHDRFLMCRWKPP